MSQDYQALARQLAGPLWPWMAARISLPLVYAQRVLNPFPLASSGTAAGDLALPQDVTVQVWQPSAFVVTTNSGVNYWSLALTDSAGTTIATVTTAAIAANTWARLSTTTIASQPAAGAPGLTVRATATGSPGAIYLIPSVVALPA